MDVNVRLSNIKDRHKLKQLNSAFIAVQHFQSFLFQLHCISIFDL